MPLFDSRVVANFDVANDYYQMDFEWPRDVPPPMPGQFFTVRVKDSVVPLLRRPFGVSGFDPGTDGGSPAVASMIYWRRGPGTVLLAGYDPGDIIGVMGPLGVGFPHPSDGAIPMLVAGGVGIGPILYLANALAAGGSAPLLLIGARTAASLPRINAHHRVQVRRATDDGSIGFHGTAIDLLEQTVSIAAGPMEIYLCGPHAMLRAGHDCASRHGLPAWVSMEQTMGCAVGACMGCAVRVHGDVRFARVCTEGPVFRSTEIAWE